MFESPLPASVLQGTGPELRDGGFAKDGASHSVPEEPLTIDELVRHRALLGPGQPKISYPRSGIRYVDYSLRQLDVFAFLVSKEIAPIVPARNSSSEVPAVVALLGHSDLSYLVILLSLSKLGHSVLLLSTRISIDAYVSLMERTGSTHIFIHGSFADTAAKLRKRLPGLSVHEIPGREEYEYPLSCNSDTNLVPHLDRDIESKNIAFIIHSSGSTSLPKPIFQTHSAAIKNYAGNMNMNGFITLPLYHNHGLSCLFRTVYSCKSLHLYNAELPLTKQYLLDIMRQHEFEIFYGVPYALKLLAESDEGITALSRLRAVMFGGSACPDSLGDRLVDNGVNLISHYGSTETGQLMTSMRPCDDKGWNYLRPSEAVRSFLRFEERGPDIFELVCLDGWPSKVMSNRPDGYATKDLFLKHRTMEAYKYYARLDDTIVLVNGEKVNPLDMEGRVRQHDAVSEAVVFGSGKPSIGMVVVRADTSMSDQDVINAVWPLAEKAQEAMPAFGRLSKNMIRILPSETMYPRTDKGTVIRQAFYRKFGELIEATYEAEDAGTGSLTLSEMELRVFIREQLQRLLPLNNQSVLTDDEDFFGLGMDSLQATQLRSVLAKALNTNGQRLGLNVAFEHPTVSLLVRYLHSLGSGNVDGTESVEEQMESLIAKYSQFERHVPTPNGLEGRYIVVTGATGSLGSHVAARLSALKDVQKIYCLVRAGSSIEAYDRLLKSMRLRRVYDSLDDTSRIKLIPLPSDLSQPHLGLSPNTYTIITTEITDIIHCAWSVNFNLRLTSFEKDSINALKNLLNLSLKTRRPIPASFNFCSSVSAVVNTPSSHIPETLPSRLSHAQSMGYAQSKLVGEYICANATKQTGLPTRVLRIGQVIGDTKYGIWNVNEAIPLMIQSARTIGVLPRLDEWPRWMPVDVVADVVVDISLSNSFSPGTPAPVLPGLKPDCDYSGVFNILNPHPFHWTMDLLPYLRNSGLEFEGVEQREWVRRLRCSNSDPVVNPPVKLVEFFAGKYDTDRKPRRVDWETAKGRAVSGAFREVRRLDQGVVDGFVGFFGECWKEEAGL